MLDEYRYAPLKTDDSEKGPSESSTIRREQARKWIMFGAVSSLFCLWQFYNAEFFQPLVPAPNMEQNFGREAWSLDAFRPYRLKPKEAEELFLTIPSPAGASKTSYDFSNVPHLAGSPADLEQAKSILKIFQDELGIAAIPGPPIYDAGSTESQTATLSLTNITTPNAWIDTYYPIMNTPLERELQIIGASGEVAWNADVEEEEIEGDEAGKYAKAVGAWHGLSKAGDVTGKLVYVNYGSREDFAELKAKGVDLTGTIAIARYGGIFRGLKVKGAQEAGAIGIVIYSDPRDDGSVTPANGYLPYPAGPARNPSSVQRGSVQFLSKYPGDPSTPGYPSYPNATRQDGLNIPSIPSLPISWNNAQVLLSEISSTFNFTLDGALSTRNIRLNNQVDVKVTPIWNAMAVIPGHVREEIVVLGCHRDAWVLGAADPISGTSALVEVVKGLGELRRKGWRPLRTILIASWDAEEPGLIGSTEYGEDFTDFLQKNVVAYLNMDVATKGSRFSVGGSPTLAHLLHSAALDVAHPTEANRTLWDARKDSGKLTGPVHLAGRTLKEHAVDLHEQEEELKEFAKPDNLNVRPLGSGSDYTVFLQRIGVASSDEGFSGTLSDPVYHYHSVYDSHHWQEVYGDPGFLRHVAVAKHFGLTALRLSDTPVLPLNTTQYALELGSYFEKVKKTASDLSVSVDFAPLEKSIQTLQSSSKRLDKAKQKAAHRLEKAIKDLEKHKHLEDTHACANRSPSYQATRRWIKRAFGVTSDDARPKIPKRIRRVMKAAAAVIAVNKKLSSFERGFISEEGIKDREWYKNIVVAPGKWTGYGATTFPALSEAIEIEQDATLIRSEVHRLSSHISRLADDLKQVSDEILKDSE